MGPGQVGPWNIFYLFLLTFFFFLFLNFVSPFIEVSSSLAGLI